MIFQQPSAATVPAVPPQASDTLTPQAPPDTVADAVYRILISSPAGAGKPDEPKLWETLLPQSGPGQATLQVVVSVVLVLTIIAIGAALCLAIFHMARYFHHLKWSEPPRRLQKAAVGAQGVDFEWERIEANDQQDEQRDRQIAELRAELDKLTEKHNRLAASTAANADSIQLLAEHVLPEEAPDDDQAEDSQADQARP